MHASTTIATDPAARNGAAITPTPGTAPGNGAPIASAAETARSISGLIFDLEGPIHAAHAATRALQDLADEPIGEHAQRAVVELVANVMGEINMLHAQFKVLHAATRTRSHAAPAPAVNDSPDRRIEALVRDFFTTGEQYDFACDDPKYRIGCPPEGDIHHNVEAACLAQEPKTISECRPLLRVARQTVEWHWGTEDWPGAVTHLLDSLGGDLVFLGQPDLERVKLDAAGPDPAVSVKIAVARDILARLGHGEPALNATRALLGRIEGVVAEAEDAARQGKAAAE